MTRSFRVWAPNAREVAWVSGERVVKADERAQGVFTASPPPAGTDYFIRLLRDGQAPRDLPDPCSRYQPNGVSGPSRWIESDFKWTDRHFRAPPLSAAVIYELHVGTFTREGTFSAAIARLPHLVTLGVTHVELMPVATFPGRWGWGYDGVDLYAPQPSYGTPDDLKRLVDACHASGLAVLLDVVYNHLGPDGNYLGEFGPYFTDRYRTPWGSAVNLDGPESDHVRQFFIDDARMWLEDYHFDGLRLDAVHALYDESASHFLADLSAEVHALQTKLHKPLVVIAESDQNDPRLLRAPALGGYGVDAQWSDDFHHAVHAVLTGERSGYYHDFGELAHVARALRKGFVYDGQHSEYRRRRHGASLREQSGHGLLAYLQNHDQIGNRARGERIGHLVSDGLLHIGAALTLTSPFVPMLFQGEEWNASAPFQYFVDHTDPKLAEAVRNGRRDEFRAFGWDPEQIPDPQAEATYRASQLDWSELERSPHREILAWYRELLALRRSSADLLDGLRDRVRVEYDESERWLRVQRGAITLCANLGQQPVRLPAPSGQLVLSHPAPPPRAAAHIELGPESCGIWRREDTR
jgi:maltooligosyltrehalose trehalohydrolase